MTEILFLFIEFVNCFAKKMGGLEAVITGLMDEFKIKSIGRELFTAIVISTSFIGALVNCTQVWELFSINKKQKKKINQISCDDWKGGGFTMVWFDTYSAGISLLCSAMFEALAVVYFYGIWLSFWLLYYSIKWHNFELTQKTGSDRFCADIESMIGFPPQRYWVLSWKYISPSFLLV